MYFIVLILMKKKVEIYVANKDFSKFKTLKQFLIDNNKSAKQLAESPEKLANVTKAKKKFLDLFDTNPYKCKYISPTGLKLISEKQADKLFFHIEYTDCYYLDETYKMFQKLRSNFLLEGRGFYLALTDDNYQEFRENPKFFYENFIKAICNI